MTVRSYGQQCPIARALDVLGERWTLLILRELLGGPRRYADLRADLPGIATNLLSDRLRHLVAHGLVERFDVPPPVSRTLYRLTDTGWRHVPPVIGALAAFGSEQLPVDPNRTGSLTAFLIGVLIGFDSHRARAVDEDYRVVLDGRTFDIGVRRGSLCGARGEPVVLLRTHPADLIKHRHSKGSRRLELDGKPSAIARFLAVFGLDPVE